MRVSLTVLLLVSAASAAAQNPIAFGVPLAEKRFGVFLIESSGGTLGRTLGSGSSLYSASATG